MTIHAFKYNIQQILTTLDFYINLDSCYAKFYIHMY